MYNFEYIVEKSLWCSDEGCFVWGDAYTFQEFWGNQDGTVGRRVHLALRTQQ